MLEIIHREAVYLWYYFDIQFRQIFWYWVLGMTLGSAVSVFLKDRIHSTFRGLGEKKLGVSGIVIASVLGIASPLCIPPFIFQYGCRVPVRSACLGRRPAGCLGHCVENCLWQSKTTAFLTKTAVPLDGKRLLHIFLTVPSIAWMPLRGKSRTVPMPSQNRDISGLGCSD